MNKRIGIAENPKASAEILAFLANDCDLEVVRAVARNTNTPAAVLEVLARNPDPQVRSNVACNPSTHPRIAIDIMKDRGVHLLVAKNETASPEVLKCIYYHGNKDVCHALCQNPNTPAKMLETLLEGADSITAQAIAKNPNCSSSVVALLTPRVISMVQETNLEDWGDEWDEVMSYLVRKPQFSQELLRGVISNPPNATVLEGALKNPTVDTDILDTFAKKDENYSSGFGYFLWAICTNVNTSTKTLEYIVKNKNLRESLEPNEGEVWWGILEAIATHPNTTTELLEFIAVKLDQDYKLWEKMITHPNASPVFRTRYLAKLNDFCKSSFNAPYKICTGDVPQEILETLFDCYSKYPRKYGPWRDICDLAGNLHTPAWILSLLARDEDADIASTALANANFHENLWNFV